MTYTNKSFNTLSYIEFYSPTPEREADINLTVFLGEIILMIIFYWIAEDSRVVTFRLIGWFLKKQLNTFTLIFTP